VLGVWGFGGVEIESIEGIEGIEMERKLEN